MVHVRFIVRCNAFGGFQVGSRGRVSGAAGGCDRLGVDRNPVETLRILDALQTDELRPCKENRGENC